MMARVEILAAFSDDDLIEELLDRQVLFQEIQSSSEFGIRYKWTTPFKPYEETPQKHRKGD